MPYRSIDDLPEQVKVLPVEAQRVFLKVFNDNVEEFGEERAFRIAWGAVKQNWEKDEETGRWVRKGMEVSFSYLAKTEPLERDGKHYAQIYVIDTTKNRAGWKVTDEALKNALSSLLGKPLIAYPDHSGQVEIGNFVEATKPDGYAVGIAEVSDEEAWKKIHGGEWKYVSPQVKGFWVKEDGVDILYDFYFEHVAFVPNPAYPDARVLAAQMEDGGLRTFSAALTSELDKVRKQKQGEIRKNMENDVAELRTKLEQSQTKISTLETSKTEAQTKIAALETANNELKASLDKILQQRRMERVNELVDLRLKAGLLEAAKRDEEANRLSKLGDDTLDLLIADTKTFTAHMPQSSGPKAKYTAEQQMDAVEAVRERLFGYKRDKDGKVVASGVV